MKRAMLFFVFFAGAAVMAAVVAPIYCETENEPVAGIEHIGLNVPDVAGAVEWFCSNLDMKIARKTGDPSNAHFLIDAAGRNMLEIYHNTSAPVPDYAAMDPLTLHFAFKVDDVGAARQRLIDAGATPVGEVSTTAAGDTLAMLRSPQGIPVQLAKRAKPMTKD